MTLWHALGVEAADLILPDNEPACPTSTPEPPAEDRPQIKLEITVKVFISHATADREFVEQVIIPFLERNGIGIWYSKKDIRTADQWERAIRKGLTVSDWFLVVMSPRSLASEWVQREVHWAMENRLGRLIPVVLESTKADDWHLGLDRIQHVDFRGQGRRRCSGSREFLPSQTRSSLQANSAGCSTSQNCRRTFCAPPSNLTPSRRPWWTGKPAR